MILSFEDVIKTSWEFIFLKLMNLHLFLYRKIKKASLSNASEVTWMSYTANFGKLNSLQVYGGKHIPGR